MPDVSTRLQSVLESECADDLAQIIRAKKKADFEELRKFLLPGPLAHPKLRTRAIFALGRWGDSKVVPDIRRVILDLDDAGLLAAIDALGRLATPTALKEVLKYADHSSPAIRKFVVHALGRFDRAEAQAKLNEIQMRDPVEHLRDLAVKYIQPAAKNQ